ncbi:hypothetical protein [Magnetospirillum sulfuroxidans]|uniref:Suppressor protein SRP40 n=1 Tax=Magnetospirillum sulfuroxidans TaxID=611300 RepID=A0ABS5IDR1_9PROT|nr:hypothetical protein [Magnetospirillum sulfuroxidans]MBR9972484.1 hypothetical protein [Magnetospirillum sulfuroxidans]
MSISSISQGSRPASLQESLSSSLQNKGLTADKAATIGSELESVAQSSMSAGTGKTDPSSIRAALENQLSQDVESGTLSADEADQVRAALDEFESQMAANRPAGGPPAGGPPPGGPPPAGGAGKAEETDEEDDSEKTALELLLESLKEASQGTDTSKAKDYLTQMMSQGLVDLKA